MGIFGVGPLVRSPARVGRGRELLGFGPGAGGLSYAEEVLADNPKFFYPLGESAGDVMEDLSGNGNHGTYINGPSLGVPGLVPESARTAVLFDRDAEQGGRWVGAADISGAWSVEAWIKLTAHAGQLIAGVRTTNLGNAVRNIQIRSNGAFRFSYQRNTSAALTLDSISTLDLDTVYHLVAVLDDDGVPRVYINGVQDNAGDPGNGSANLNASVLVGFSETSGEVPSAWLDGAAQYVAVYDHALSPERVLVHYNAGIGES